MQTAEKIECNGDAHKEINIDHCFICMPYWGYFYVCPTHKTSLTPKLYCKKCRKRYKAE